MIVGLLLAAGRGRRFGGAKQCAKLPDGRTLLYASACQMRAAIDDVTIVVSEDPVVMDHAADVARELDCRFVVNARTDQGMATSIATGVQANPGAAGWIIGLGDMPLVKTSTIAGVAAVLEQGQAIVVPTYRQQRGHPVGFGSQYADELKLLDGETGGRDLIARHHLDVAFFACGDPGVTIDVDLPSDLSRTLVRNCEFSGNANSAGEKR